MHWGKLNIALTIEKYTTDTKDMRITITVKPCGAISLVELIQRNRINGDNFFYGFLRNSIYPNKLNFRL